MDYVSHESCVRNLFLYISARLVNYRPRAAELIVPAGSAPANSTSSAAINCTPNSKY